MNELNVVAPYNHQHLKSYPLSDATAAFAMLDQAQKIFANRDQWLQPYERKTILQDCLILLTQRKQEFAVTAAQEGGKPLIDSLIEVERAILGIQIAIEEISHMTGREIAMNQTPGSVGRMAYTYREPGGVVLAISAFNHPLNLIIHQVIPAIAVGCPVIVKPASSTPISCFNLIELLYQAGLPKAWCQALVCKSDVAEQLVKDPRVSFLSFIGSARVGWHLRSILAPGAHCALEHGGAAPVIVAADADLETALPLLVKGGFYHAGQVCVSVQRVFADKKIANSLAKRMAKLAEQLQVGDPTDSKTEVGPLIDPKEVDRVALWVDEARKAGAKVLSGGERISKTCYAPTVLLDPPMDAKVSQAEIFGPVVCVYSYDDRLQAIQLANQLPFLFQASVFTQDLNVALDSVKRLQATAVMINDHTAFRVDWMPFGGRRESGLGFGGIPYSMHDMSYEKMLVMKSPLL